MVCDTLGRSGASLGPRLAVLWPRSVRLRCVWCGVVRAVRLFAWGGGAWRLWRAKCVAAPGAPFGSQSFTRKSGGDRTLLTPLPFLAALLLGLYRQLIAFLLGRYRQLSCSPLWGGFATKRVAGRWPMLPEQPSRRGGVALQPVPAGSMTFIRV